MTLTSPLHSGASGAGARYWLAGAVWGIGANGILRQLATVVVRWLALQPGSVGLTGLHLSEDINFSTHTTSCVETLTVLA